MIDIDGVKVGDKILVRNFDSQEWVEKLFLAKVDFEDPVFGKRKVVFAREGLHETVCNAYLEAKKPETDWSKVPIGTIVNCWDDFGSSTKEDPNIMYLAAVINNVPFVSYEDTKKFNKNFCNFNNTVLMPFQHVELREED